MEGITKATIVSRVIVATMCGEQIPRLPLLQRVPTMTMKASVAWVTSWWQARS
jgi:hypothetical protein